MSSAEGMTLHIIISFSRMSSSSIIHTKWIRWRECVGGGISVQVQLLGTDQGNWNGSVPTCLKGTEFNYFKLRLCNTFC